jgi:hypothetical protein
MELEDILAEFCVGCLGHVFPKGLVVSRASALAGGGTVVWALYPKIRVVKDIVSTSRRSSS